ncbi:hypothetical protein EYF80_018871 [Liparis tanakae]|uniref:Uncharacterized protein n=1 Tax=Liparis tanakae TaxID=230148 RepID=A0A4Z2HYG1_9TELE|nr:hypothetical protein EYF80_018871 [Liparis tanakae]
MFSIPTDTSHVIPTFLWRKHFSVFSRKLAGLTLSTAAAELRCASLLFSFSLCRFSFAFFALCGNARKLLILKIFRAGVAGTAAAVERLALAGPKLHFAGLPQLCFPLCFSPAHTSPFSFLCFRPFSSTRTFLGGGGRNWCVRARPGAGLTGDVPTHWEGGQQPRLLTAAPPGGQDAVLHRSGTRTEGLAQPYASRWVYSSSVGNGTLMHITDMTDDTGSSAQREMKWSARKHRQLNWTDDTMN